MFSEAGHKREVLRTYTDTDEHARTPSHCNCGAQIVPYVRIICGTGKDPGDKYELRNKVTQQP